MWKQIDSFGFSIHLLLQPRENIHNLSWAMSAQFPRPLLSAVESEAVSTVISPLFLQAENPHLRIFTLYLLRDPRASLADIKVDCIVWSNLILVRPWQVYFPPHVSAYLSWWWCPGVFRPWESSGRGEGVLSKSMETTVIRRCLLHNLQFFIIIQITDWHVFTLSWTRTRWFKSASRQSLWKHQFIKKWCLPSLSHSNHHLQHVVLDGLHQLRLILPRMMSDDLMSFEQDHARDKYLSLLIVHYWLVFKSNASGDPGPLHSSLGWHWTFGRCTTIPVAREFLT